MTAASRWTRPQVRIHQSPFLFFFLFGIPLTDDTSSIKKRAGLWVYLSSASELFIHTAGVCVLVRVIHDMALSRRATWPCHMQPLCPPRP